MRVLCPKVAYFLDRPLTQECKVHRICMCYANLVLPHQKALMKHPTAAGFKHLGTLLV